MALDGRRFLFFLLKALRPLTVEPVGCAMVLSPEGFEVETQGSRFLKHLLVLESNRDLRWASLAILFDF